LKLKIVVRRTDIKGGNSNNRNSIGGGAGPGNDKSHNESCIGLTLCRSECIEDNVLKNKLKKQPRLSAVGEVR